MYSDTTVSCVIQNKANETAEETTGNNDISNNMLWNKRINLQLNVIYRLTPDMITDQRYDQTRIGSSNDTTCSQSSVYYKHE
jgi:hypothetical protein